MPPAKPAAAPTAKEAEKQLAGFIDKFDPKMARLIRATRKKMRALLPGASELVYDNYNFFVIGYGPTEKTSLAVFSLAAQANGLTLFFLQGVKLPDPHKLLKGSGNVVRSIPLEGVETLDRPEVGELMEAALAKAKVPIDAGAKHQLLIKSVSAKQRPRRASK